MGLSLRNIGKKLTDFGSRAFDQVNVFDNNRTWQQRTPTQSKSTFQQAGQATGQIARGTVGATARTLNTVAGGLSQVPSTVRGQVAVMTNNKEALKNALIAQENMRQQVYGSQNSGLLGKGTIYTSPEDYLRPDANSTSFIDDIAERTRRFSSTGAESALELASMGMGGVVGKQLVQQGIKKGLTSQIPVITKNALLNTTQGGVNAYNQGASGKDILKSAAIGGTVGTVADVGLGLAGAGASKAAKSHIKPVYALEPEPKPKVSLKSDPLESLRQEARKYKNAEEFVKNNFVAHGTNKEILGNLQPTNGWYGKAVYTTDDLANASGRNGGGVTYFVNKPQGKLLEINAHGSKGGSGFTPQQYQDAIKNGYDGLKIKHDDGKTWYAMFNEQTPHTKQQLTDLYNQATQSQPPKSPLKTDPLESLKQEATTVEKFGWKSEVTPEGTKLINRDGKHVATITEKKGRFTASYVDGQRIATGLDANKLAEDVARKTFYAQEIPQNTGGTIRPDKTPEPFKNNVWQSEMSPERAIATQANVDSMKASLEFDKTPTPKKAYHSTASLEIEGGKLRASSDGVMGEGVYLHTDPNTAKYAGAMQADGNIADQQALDINLKTDNLYKWADQNYPTSEQLALIKKRGYDGVYKKGGEIVVFDPNKIELSKATNFKTKSTAEPNTVDLDTNSIPQKATQPQPPKSTPTVEKNLAPNPVVKPKVELKAPEQIKAAQQETLESIAGKPKVFMKEKNNLGDVLNMDRYKNPTTVEKPKVDLNTQVGKLSDDDMVNQMVNDLGISPTVARVLLEQNNKPALATNLYGSKELIRNARNPDAYAEKIMSEAQKRSGQAAKQNMPSVTLKENPTVRIDDNTVDTVTGEILERPKRKTFVEQYQQTDPKKLTPEQQIQTREELWSTWNEGVDAIEKRVQDVTGHSIDDFNRVLQAHARDTSMELPGWYKLFKDEYDSAIRSFRKILPEDVGDITKDGASYSPNARPGSVGSSGSLSDDIDFFFSQKRTNAIPLEELDYSSTPLRNLGDQLINNKFKLPEQKALAKEMADAVNEGGVISSGVEKMDIVDKMSKLGDAKQKSKTVLDTSTSRLKRNFSSSEELYDGVMMPDGRTMNEAMGFSRYTNAEGLAYTINEEAGDNVVGFLNNRYKDVPIDPKVKDKIIRNAEYRLDRLNPDNLTPEEMLLQRHSILSQAEKNVAREQLTEFLETTTLVDKQLQKNLNYDAKRMLLQDRANQSIAEKMVNGYLGLTYTGALGYNPMSALNNVLENKRVAALFTPEQTATATKKAFTDPDITVRYGIHETKVSDVLEQRGKAKKPRLWKPMGLFQKTEAQKDAILLHAFEAKHKAAGLTGTELTEKVLKDFNKYAIKYGQAGSLGFNKSKLGRLWGQFLQFTIKDLKITGGKTLEAIGKKGADDATKLQAQKYLAKLGAQNVAIYLTLSAAFGASWEHVFGVTNPIQGYDKEDATLLDKAVRRVPGGPAVDMTKDLYFALTEEFRNAKNEGRDISIDGVINNQIKKDAALFVPGGNQFLNKTGGFLADQQRGYNENQQGRARFESSKDPLNIARGLVLGRYSTDNAREYFGSSGIAGDLTGRGGEQQNPVGQRYQDQIQAGANVGETIYKSRENSNRSKEFYNSPQGKQWSELNSTTYNSITGKKESDIISPEKWKAVQADKTDKTYNQLKEAANQRSRDFGDPLDPIYTDKWGKYKTEILTMRSQFTGDDTEMKDIANVTKPWYKKYMKDYISYIDKMKNNNYQESEEYGTSQRAKDYYELTVKNPSIPDNTKATYPLISQYYDIKNRNPDEAKQFFKDHVDELSTNFDQQKIDKWNWTNQMRTLEGVEPIDWQTFQNITFGYEDDERKVFNELKYGKGYGGYGSGGSGKTFGSLNPLKYALSTSVDSASGPKVGYRVANKARPSIARRAISAPKVSIKKSLV